MTSTSSSAQIPPQGSTPLQVGRLVQLGRQRQIDDLRRWPAHSQQECRERGDPYWFSEAAAQHAVDFFPRFLRHSKGRWAGQPFRLESWQEHDIIRPLFGWMRADGTRRFREALVEVARKNGKSTLAAGIGLYLTVADHEAGAEVYTAATKRDQARIIHSEAIRMVRASPGLLKHCSIFKDNINVKRLGAKFEPLGADADSMDGLNPSGVLLDEVHAHKNRKVYDVLDTATGARSQPLFFSITTAGFKEKEALWWPLHVQAIAVLEGAHRTQPSAASDEHRDADVRSDEEFFVYIATLDEGDDWTDERTWGKGNPNLGVSVSLEELRAKSAKARQNLAYQNAFRRLRLNQCTEQSERAIDMDQWRASAGAITPSQLIGRPCFAGLDLSSKQDLTALVLVFPLEYEAPHAKVIEMPAPEAGGGEGQASTPPPVKAPENVQYAVLCFFWLPRDNMRKRVEHDRVPYDAWANQGFIELTEGVRVDYSFIRRRVNELSKQYQIQEVPYDPWNAYQLEQQLREQDGFTTVEMRQGYKTMSDPTKELLALIAAGRFLHGNHPVLSWNASNFAVEQDANENIKPSKKKSTERIDGLVAGIMALARALVSPIDTYDGEVMVV